MAENRVKGMSSLLPYEHCDHLSDNCLQNPLLTRIFLDLDGDATQEAGIQYRS